MRADSRAYIFVGQAIMSGVLVAFYLLSINAWSDHPEKSDFTKFYASTRFLLEGGDIYSPVPIDAFSASPDASRRREDTPHQNLNPPFQTLLLAPLGLLGYRAAFWMWSTLALLSGIAGATLIGRTIQKEREGTRWLSGFLILLLAYFPTWLSILCGQFSLLLLLLLAVAWAASRSGKDQMAGIALGLAMSLKVFVGLFLLFFLVRRRWRLLCWFIGTFLACGLVALAALGMDSYQQYQTVLSSVTWYAASWNASFMGFFTRIFGGSENTPLINTPGLAYALAYGSSLWVTLCLIWLAWPRPDTSSPERFDLGVSMTLVAMLLISPLGWMYYFPLLFLPAVVAWRVSDMFVSASRYKATIVLAWLLSTIPSIYIPAPELNRPIDWFTWVGAYCYALLIFSVILVVLSYRLNTTDEKTVS